MFHPKRLVFSGGGTRCLIFLPALRSLERRGILRNVTEWWGTSAGSLTASLLALTRSADRTAELLQGVEFAKFRDVNLMNVVSLNTSWGLDDGSGMVSEVERVLDQAKSGSSKLTLQDVDGLNIFVADLTTHKTVQCNAKTYPSLRIVDAIRASMSLPIFYVPFRCPTTGNVWVDGGVRAHFPWNYMESDKDRKESLGFAFERAWMNGPRTFSEYMFSILHFDEPDVIRSLKQKWPSHILWFPSPPFPAWYVRLKSDDFALLDQYSTQTVNAWFTDCLPKMSQSPPLCEDPRTPSRERPVRHTGGTSESLKSSSPLLPPCPSQDSQRQMRLPSRRWSF